MIRATTIALTLMGGGALVSIAPALRHDRCAEARAAHLPDAEQICAAHGGSHSGGGWWHSSSGSGRSGGMVATAAGTSGVSTSGVSRGGFGAAGAHASAGS